MSERTETDFNDLNTRNSLVNNTVFVNKAQNVLTEVFGDEELYETDEDVIDAFYQKFRGVDVNTIDSMRLYNKIGNIDDTVKQDLKEVYEVYRALPSFWEDDTASAGQAFIDYALGIFSDPLTYASVIGGSGAAAKAAASGLVMAGIKNATTAGLKSAAITSAGIDVASSTLGDAYIQNAEKELELREKYSVSQGALAAGAAVVPTVAASVAVPAIKAGFKKIKPSSTDIVKSIREGKEVYLKGSDAGQAFLKNEMVEGSFVNIPQKTKTGEKFIDENLGYVETIDRTNNTAVVNVGFDDETGNAIQKTVALKKLQLEDPFSTRVQKKINKQVLKDSQIYNTVAAKEGFEQLQKEIMETLGIKQSDMPSVNFILSEEAIGRLNNVYSDIILESKMIYNPNKRISQNVADAIRNGMGGFTQERLSEILAMHRISAAEFAAFTSGGYMGSISQAASLLGKQGKLKKDLTKEFLSELNGGINARYKKITQKLKPEDYYITIGKEASEKLEGKKYIGGTGKKSEADPKGYDDINIKNAIADIVGNKDFTPDAEAYFTQALAERGKTDKWIRSLGDDSLVNRIIRLGMISQPATTVRNVIGFAIRSPVDAVTRTFDNAITSVFNMPGGGQQVRPVNWLDGWDHISSLFNPQEHKLLVDFIASQNPEIRKKLFSGPEAFMESMELTKGLKGDRTGIINRTTNGVEKMFVKFNVLNQLQDRYNKSQAFTVGLKHSMWRDGLDLFEFVRKGELENIDPRYYEEAMEWALEANYQLPGLEKYPFANMLQMASKLPFGLGAAVMPFPKFFFNSVRYMYQHSPVATATTAIDLAVRNSKRKELGKLTSFEKQKYIRKISQQMAGTSLVLTAFALRNSEYAGEKWNELFDYDGGILDIATWYPLAPALYVAEGIKQLLDFDNVSDVVKNTARVFGWEPSKEYRSGSWTDFTTGYSEDWRLNFGKAFGGPTTRSGVFKIMDANFIASLVSGDEDAAGVTQSLLGQYMGSVLGAVLQPVKLPTDIYREFNLSDEVRLYREHRTSKGFLDNFVNIILKDTPFAEEQLVTEDSGLIQVNDDGSVAGFALTPPEEGKFVPAYKYTAINPKPLRISAPLMKQFTGAFRRDERTAVESEFARLGIPEFKLFRRTKIPEYDRVLKGLTAKFISGPLYEYINSKEYREIDDIVLKTFLLNKVASKMKSQVSSKVNSLTVPGIMNKINRHKPVVKRYIIDGAIEAGILNKDGEVTDKYSIKGFSGEELQLIQQATKNFTKYITEVSKLYMYQGNQ